MNIFKRYLATCFLVALGTIAPNAQAQTASVLAYSVDSVTSRAGYFDAGYTFRRSFASNDPNFAGKTDYLKRNISIAKTGNPLNWVKNNALTLAVTGAVLAAGYAIDELTNQVMNPSAAGSPPVGEEAFYEQLADTFWTTSSNGTGAKFPSAYNAVEDHFATYVAANGSASNTYYTISWINQNQLQATYKFISSDFTRHIQTFYRFQAAGYVTWEDGTTYPNAGPQPVPDAEVWTLLEPVFQANPEYLAESLVDPYGNPYYFQPVADAADAIGAGVSGYTDYSGQIVTEPVGSAPDIGSDSPPLEIDLPTDYAREDTTQGIRSAVEELAQFFNGEITDHTSDPNADYLDQVYAPVESAMNSIADPVDPTGLLPALPQYSATCETLSYGMMGSTFTFPTASQCDKLNTGKSIIGWFLYLVTGGLIVNLFLSRTGRAVA